MFELHHLSAREQVDWLRRGEVTPLELADHYLARIERHNASLGAFTTVAAERARERAATLPAPTAAQALWGLPLAEKDLERRAGVRATFGSRAFEHHIPDESDESVLARDAAGAVSLGATHAPEFGMPSYTESRVAPPARTPWNPALGAGGSSGGAAVAVAAGLLPLAPGSDGGGSIRIPAAATGLVGLKPSRGRVPTGSGMASLGGLAVHGPLARSVGDAALLLDALTQDQPYGFATAAPSWDGGAFSNAAMRGEGRFQVGLTLASPWQYDHELTIAPEARDALDLAVRELTAVGHGVEELDWVPEPGYGPAFRAVWQGGAATLPVDGAELELLEPLTRWLVAEGRALTARALASSLAVLTAYERSVIRAFAGVDVVLTPTLAMTPRPVGWFDPVDPERNFAQQVQYTPWTSFVNVAGLPAITLPVHVTAEGLPMGVQLIGRPGREDVLLAIGAQLERRLRWDRRHPPQW